MFTGFLVDSYQPIPGIPGSGGTYYTLMTKRGR
jgi:hypothetical protein